MATQKLDVLHTVLLQLREILKLHTLLYSIYRKFLAVILEFFNTGKMSKAGKVGLIYLIKKPSAAKRTVYWIWPLFLEDGKLEFDCITFAFFLLALLLFLVVGVSGLWTRFAVFIFGRVALPVSPTSSSATRNAAIRPSVPTRPREVTCKALVVNVVSH